MVEIIKNLVEEDKYGIKCPYAMEPVGITVHNTGNSASADAEVSYMISNNNEVSYHFAVDENHAVQGLPLNRNAWHCGDGNGKGNRKTIAVEICRSTSEDESLFDRAEENAAELMLQAKGFENAIVSISDGNADVVISSEGLTNQQIAQIEDIVKRKTGIAADKIVITPVNMK